MPGRMRASAIPPIAIRVAAGIACLFVACSRFSAQTALAVAPGKLEFRGVSGGPPSPAQTVKVSSTGISAVDWTATVEAPADGALQVKPVSGSTPATLTVSWAAWFAASKEPGGYAGKITITPTSGTPATVDVSLAIVAASPSPTFSYLSGPNKCSRPPGYLDDALCEAPGERPPGDFTPPRAGESYVDPNFGATVRILTPTGYNHIYSTPSALSATNRYTLVASSNGLEAVMTATGKSVYQHLEGDVNKGFYWDVYNDDSYYWLQGTAVKKRDLMKGKTVTLVDYSGPPYNFTSITAGGTGDTSKDNWVAFWAPKEKTVCALDLSHVKTYCGGFANLSGPPMTFIDFTLITKGVDSSSGKRYVLLMANPAFAAFSVNLAAGKLDFEFRGPENPAASGNHDNICDPGEVCFGAPHSDVFQDDNGVQYLVSSLETETPCERALYTYQINTGLGMLTPVELGGGKRKVMTMFVCGTAWTDDHIGCARSAPFCVISTNYQGLRDPTDQAPIRRTPHLSEIFVMRGNGVEIRRLAEHRSVPFKTEEANGYWTLTRASISSDGSLVVADSNFGYPSETRVVVIKTGYGRPKVAGPSAVNAASFEAPVAPGSYVTIFGASLTDGYCTDSAKEFPIRASLCGTTVSLNDLPARIYYASPEQLNLIAPQALSPGQKVLVKVARQADSADPFEVPADLFLETAPAIFEYFLEDLVPRAVVQNSDNTLNGPPRTDISSRPLRLGEAGVIWVNGLGPVKPPVADGQPAPVLPLTRTVREVEVYVNGVRQNVFFSGLAPTYCALYQVNFTLNSSTPLNAENQNRIWLRVNGVESPHLVISLNSSS